MINIVRFITILLIIGGVISQFYMIFYRTTRKHNLFILNYIIAIFVFIIAASVVTNYVVYGSLLGYKIPSALKIETVSLDPWIGFFGNMFGAIIGGMITLTVMYYNISQLTKKSNQQMILQYRPCFDLHIYDDNKKKFTIENNQLEFFDIFLKDNEFGTVVSNINEEPTLSGYNVKIKLENVSNSLAYNIRYGFSEDNEVITKPIQSIQFVKGLDCFDGMWFFPFNKESDCHDYKSLDWNITTLVIYFQDILANEYCQSVSLMYKYNDKEEKLFCQKSRITVPKRSAYLKH